ncbi:WD_REPEATS_REGION domain-containing protein [Pseudozyma hubeiensis]|nr:WD_REPEATS_REGION domain-containing protein [Pseudozyma hubeiensis]
MSSSDLYDLTLASHLIVEQFLLTQGYTSTATQLRTDAAAAGLALPPLSASDPPDLRHVVESYRSRVSAESRKAQSTSRSSLSTPDPLTLTLPGPPTLPYHLSASHTTLHASNILSISHLLLPRRTFSTATSRYTNTIHAALVTTAADKRIVFSNPTTGEVEEILEDSREAHQAAVLCVAQDPLDPRVLVSCGMDGKVVVWDLLERKVVQVLQEHSRFVVRVAYSESGEYLASIGYDRKVVIYRRLVETTFRADDGEEQEEEEEEEVEGLKGPRYEKVFELETKSNPEAILFVRAGMAPVQTEEGDGAEEVARAQAAEGKRTWLCFTVRNDCFVHYIALPTSADSSIHNLSNVSLLDTPSSKPTPTTTAADWSLHSFNTNPDIHDTHVSYSLLSLTLHPSSNLICIQTGDHTPTSLSSSTTSSTSSTLSRLLLLPALSSRRALTIFTGVSTSSYASPRHSWLPDGSACWLNSEDGVLRLVDLKGKTRASVLAHGIDASGEAAGGERDLAATWTRGGNTIVKDVVVLAGEEGKVTSCGFDRTVRIVSL